LREKCHCVYTLKAQTHDCETGRESCGTKEMAAKYAKVLNFYPGYKDDSIRFIISYFKKSGVFKDIDGALKTDVVKAGGYDSYIDGPHVSCIFPLHASQACSPAVRQPA
jgi:hypothetical protein